MSKILYISTLCSSPVLEYIFKTAVAKPEQAAQKFHRLLAEGFANLDSTVQLETLSSIPVTSANHKKKFWKLPNETHNKVRYSYIPILNLPVIKNLIVLFYTFFKVVLWSILNTGSQKFVVCDVLNITMATAAQLACKLCGTKSIVIVTDLPGLMVANVTNKTERKIALSGTIYSKLVNYIMHRFNGYVLLTLQMNAIANPFNKPYMIMEGLVDTNMENTHNTIEAKSDAKILLYAGGLYEKYGVKALIDAFLLLEDKKAALHLYGNGDMLNQIDNYEKQDKRITFKGMVPNAVVVEDQLKATLLINPRPTTEEFTTFSFPSKNMEYMVSGTPMVTTKLPGMPNEYLEYVYTFKEETIESMRQTLTTLLGKQE
jgi:glycosyltransferase involved in cell wall biosynthesis